MSTDTVPPSLCLWSQPQKDFLGAHGLLRYFTNAKGQRIAHYFWPAHSCFPSQQGKVQQQPRAIIHIVHGHGGYLCYDYLANPGCGQLHVYEGSWVQQMNLAGFSVCGIDNQGAGRSEGLRCYCDSFDDYIADVSAAVKRATTLDLPGFPAGSPAPAPIPQAYAAAGKKAAAGNDEAATHTGSDEHSKSGTLPHFILGGSLGGCLATMVSLKHPNMFSGTILLAPMISLEKLSKQGLNPYLRSVGKMVSYLLPQFPCASASRNTVYPGMQACYDADPQCWHSPTRARNAMEYLKCTGQLMACGGLEKVVSPLLIFHGLNDTMCDIDGSKALYDRSSSQDKTLRLLSKFWHVLTMEPGNEEILAEVIEWVSQRSPALTFVPPSVTPSPAVSTEQTNKRGKRRLSHGAGETSSAVAVNVHASTRTAAEDVPATESLGDSDDAPMSEEEQHATKGKEQGKAEENAVRSAKKSRGDDARLRN